LQPGTWTTAWGGDFLLSHCQVCDGNYITPLALVVNTCPYCGQAVWQYVDEAADKPVYTQPPEQMLPFSLTPAQVQQALSHFIRKSWFAPADLTLEQLNGRLHPLFLPVWLVDASAEAQWQAEVGFNYQIVSHREQYDGGGWHSKQITETKIRWEPRLGRLQRRYDNQPAPALEEHLHWRRVLGAFETEAATAYQPEAITNAIVRLPNRPPDDAWPDAEAALKTAAAAECRQAAAADHMRDFRWAAAYHDQNWTQLLVPIYTTYYRDDEGVARIIYIHGQTGRLAGQRRASLKSAKKWSVGIGMAAAGLFALSLILAAAGFFEASLLPWAVIGLMASFGVGITAVLPLLLAYATNSFGLFTPADQRPLAELVAAIRAR